jgi:hypothetical protein
MSLAFSPENRPKGLEAHTPGERERERGGGGSGVVKTRRTPNGSETRGPRFAREPRDPREPPPQDNDDSRCAAVSRH